MGAKYVTCLNFQQMPKCIGKQNLPIRLGCFLALVILLLLPKVIWNLIGNSASYWYDMGRAYSFVILYPASLFLLYFWVSVVHKEAEPFKIFGLEFNSNTFKEWLLGFFLGAFGVTLYMLYFFLLKEVHWSGLAHMSLSLLLMETSWFAGAVGLVLIEELFFRGFLFYEAYKDHRKGWFAILLTSILFAILHFNIHFFLPLFVMGLLLGQAKFYFDLRIAFGIGLHASWIFLFWGSAMAHLWTWQAGSNGSNPFNNILLVLLLAQWCLFLLLQCIKKRTLRKKN